MSAFWEWTGRQWAKSNIISGLLALMIWGAIVYLSIVGQDPPGVLIGAGGLIIGYFFKSKSG